MDLKVSILGTYKYTVCLFLRATRSYGEEIESVHLGGELRSRVFLECSQDRRYGRRAQQASVKECGDLSARGTRHIRYEMIVRNIEEPYSNGFTSVSQAPKGPHLFDIVDSVLMYKFG